MHENLIFVVKDCESSKIYGRVAVQYDATCMRQRKIHILH